MAVEVGGVRTNFRMPDVFSIGLGGGSHVVDTGRGIEIGPTSVGYRLTSDALIFGGSTLTTSDVMAAAGRAGFGDAAKVAHLPQDLVARTQRAHHGNARAIASSDRGCRRSRCRSSSLAADRFWSTARSADSK